jgi:hypothetical protein
MEAFIMNQQNFLDSSGAFPMYLNWNTSATKYTLPDEPTARSADFSCYVYEFALYQESPKVEQTVVYK